jgi:Predicted transcriptional regulator
MTKSEEIRAILGISRAEFGRRYNIPLRTLEDWDAGRKSPPEYVLQMLERIVREDKEERWFLFLGTVAGEELVAEGDREEIQAKYEALSKECRKKDPEQIVVSCYMKSERQLAKEKRSATDGMS